MIDIVERLKANGALVICPFDPKSPEYWSTPNDKPCKFCGGEPDGPDKCTGADTRIMAEAAAEITRLRSERDAAKAMCDEMAKALETSKTAIEDWLHIYAPDECKSERVAEAYARIREHGTLAYIASVLAENRLAIAAYDKAQEVGNDQ